MEKLILSGCMSVVFFWAPCLGAAGPDPAERKEAAVLDIGARRELFVDYYLIDRMEGTELRLHYPQRREVVLKLDSPWDLGNSAFVTVIKGDAKYLMYYRGNPTIRDHGQSVTCYAESEDGIHWRKPELGLFEVCGTKKNNVIMALDVEAGYFTGNFFPFLDTRPDVSGVERFKALAGGEKSGGLCAYVSADGIHWKLKKKFVITKGRFDSQNTAFWSQSEACYVCFFRIQKFYGAVRKATGKQRYARWVSRTTSKDFLNWTEPVEMIIDDPPLEHFYTNVTQPYFRAPHIYISLAARAVRNTGLTDEEKEKITKYSKNLLKFSWEGVFMTCRSNTRYDRTFREGYIRPGFDYREWTYVGTSPVCGMVQTGPEEISLYVHRHGCLPSQYVERLTLRLDGFVSVRAPYMSGEMVTKPFKFKGKELEINFATSAVGHIRVEIQSAEGAPFPGYREADCPNIVGNRIEQVVQWDKGADASTLSGKPVRLRFVMKDADLYSIRFR